MTSQEIKLHCLNLASPNGNEKQLSPEEIIEAAKKFEAFITGQDTQPQ